MNKQETKLLHQLRHDWEVFTRGIQSLKTSLDKCRDIGLKEQYSFEELESYDSLTSKFARLSDILTQKIFKTIMLLLRENAPTLIDRANVAEKLEIIHSADLLIQIRDMRNDIVHEYFIEQLITLYADIFELTEKLVEFHVEVERYIVEKKWIKV